jgi:hypothetical protein
MSTMPDSPEQQTERAFRRGYLHGAQAVIEAVERHLPERDRQTLSVWVALALAPWSLAPVGSHPSPPAAPRL